MYYWILYNSNFTKRLQDYQNSQESRIRIQFALQRAQVSECYNSPAPQALGELWVKSQLHITSYIGLV